jgi:putative FmdB family regulatory protein
MPNYEFQCVKCERRQCRFLKVSDFEKGQHQCEECEGELRRAFFTPPNFTIPGHSTYDGITKVSGGKGSKQEQRVPINIIDENPDGSCTVTRIGRKQDIENE